MTGRSAFAPECGCYVYRIALRWVWCSTEAVTMGSDFGMRRWMMQKTGKYKFLQMTFGLVLLTPIAHVYVLTHKHLCFPVR